MNRDKIINCKGRVWYPKNIFGSFRPCSKRVWKDGYCKQHHPGEIKAKRMAKENAYQASIERKHNQNKINEAYVITIGSSLCPSCLQPISQNYLKCHNELHEIFKERKFIKD